MTYKTPLSANNEIPKLTEQDYLNIEKNIRNAFIGIQLTIRDTPDKTLKDEVMYHVNHLIGYMRKLKGSIHD